MNASYLVRIKRPVKIADNVSNCWLIVSCVFLLMIPMGLMCMIPHLPPKQIFTTKQMNCGKFCDITNFKKVESNIVVYDLSPEISPIQYVVEGEQNIVHLLWIVEGQVSVLCKDTGIHRRDLMLSVSHDRSFEADFTTC